MKIIKFPRAEDLAKKKIAESSSNLETPLPLEFSRIYTKGVSYTCSCGNVSKIEQVNMIFRSIEFYCDRCGAPHKMSNPAFFPPVLRK